MGQTTAAHSASGSLGRRPSPTSSPTALMIPRSTMISMAAESASLLRAGSSSAVRAPAPKKSSSDRGGATLRGLPRLYGRAFGTWNKAMIASEKMRTALQLSLCNILRISSDKCSHFLAQKINFIYFCAFIIKIMFFQTNSHFL